MYFLGKRKRRRIFIVGVRLTESRWRVVNGLAGRWGWTVNRKERKTAILKFSLRLLHRYLEVVVVTSAH